MRRFTAIVMILLVLIPCGVFADTGEKPTQDKPLVKTTTPIKIDEGKTGGGGISWVWIILGVLLAGGAALGLGGGGGGGGDGGGDSGSSNINFGW